MAQSADAAMLWHGIDVIAPDDPLAAGLTGRVPLYRGPGYVTVASVPAAATVVARGPDGDGRPAAFRYDTGAELGDGRAAPALRIGLFPTKHGPVPWLLDDTGRAMLVAAVRLAAAVRS